MNKAPWEEYPEIWKTESAFMSWIRGGIRKALWNRHPVKLNFIKNNRIRIPNPNPRGRVDEVWGAECALTGEIAVISEMEVDHRTGGHSLKTLDDLNSFISGIVLITEDDLQFVTKKAHKIKSHSERKDVTFEEARIEKEIIAITKLPVKEVIAFCKAKGYTDELLSNAAKRKKAVVEILKKEK